MGKKVAVVGEVNASAGAVLFEGATSGAWQAGTVQYKAYAKLRIGGAAAVHEASCTFTFQGDVSGTEVLTLSASPKTLQGGASQVLVDGDQVTSSKYGNKLAVAAKGKVATS